MTDYRTQLEFNQREWADPANWTTIYFSKNDSRTWVPKRNPKHGWTINFGSASGARWIYCLFGIFFLLGSALGAFFGTLVKLVP